MRIVILDPLANPILNFFYFPCRWVLIKILLRPDDNYFVASLQLSATFSRISCTLAFTSRLIYSIAFAENILKWINSPIQQNAVLGNNLIRAKCWKSNKTCLFNFSPTLSTAVNRCLPARERNPPWIITNTRRFTVNHFYFSIFSSSSAKFKK